jgi:PST family polysaccharide transporter
MVAMIFDAFGSIGTVVLTRRLAFRPEALINLASATAFTGIALALAPSQGVWAVGLGVIAGSALQTVLSYVIAPRRIRFRIDWVAARELFSFGAWILIIEVLSIGGATVLQVIVGRELGVAALGIYYLATRLVFVPRDVIRRVVHDVMFPLHVRLRSDLARAERVFRGALGGLSVLTIPSYVILLVLTPSLVVDVLGSAWTGAEPVLQLLSLSAIACVLPDVTHPLLEGRGRPHLSAAIHATRSCVMVVFAMVLTVEFGVVGAALAWLLSEIIVMVAAGVLAGHIIVQPFEGLARRAAGIGIASVIGAIVAYGLDLVLPGGLGVVAAASMGLVTSMYTFGRLDQLFNLDLVEGMSRATPWLRSPSRTRPDEQRQVPMS